MPYPIDGSGGYVEQRQPIPVYAGYNANTTGVDASTAALMTVDYEHHEIHSGSHYFIQDVQDLAINAVIDVQFTTPNTAKWSHFVFRLECESETEWYIYEGATISAAGSSVTPINNNRNSSNTSGNTIAIQSNSSLANANADTDVSGATELAHGIIGAGRDSGIRGRAQEIILKQNTIYCMRAVANAAGYVDFTMEWYEHTDKN